MYGASVEAVYFGSVFLAFCIGSAKPNAISVTEKNKSCAGGPLEVTLYNVVFGEIGDVPAEQIRIFKPSSRDRKSVEIVKSYPSNGENSLHPIKGVALRCGWGICDFRNDEFIIEDGGLGEDHIKLKIKTVSERGYAYILDVFTENSSTPAERTRIFKPNSRDYESVEMVKSYPSNGENGKYPIKGVVLRCGWGICDLEDDEFVMEDGCLGENHFKLRITTKNNMNYPYMLYVFTENS